MGYNIEVYAMKKTLYLVINPIKFIFHGDFTKITKAPERGE